MSGFYAVLVAILGFSTAQAAEVNLSRQGGEVAISAAVQSDFAGSEAQVSAPDKNTIEVAVVGADFAVDGKRQLFRFDDSAIKTVSVSRSKGAGILRFNVKEKNAGIVADLVQIQRADDHIVVTIPTVVDAAAQTIAGTKVISIAPGPSKTEAAAETPAPKATLTAGSGPTEKPEDKALASSTVKDSNANEKANSEASMPLSFKDKRPESEIPVFTDKAEAKRAGGSSLERLVLSLFVVCALLAAALFGLKRWAARRTKNVASPTKINVLTQHYLGPKKSLAIIQVAGEAILIGITDQNISMLKTLALIDDEVPGVVPKNFADEMEADSPEAQQLAEEGYEPENFAMSGVNDVRDLLSTRFGSKGRDA